MVKYMYICSNALNDTIRKNPFLAWAEHKVLMGALMHIHRPNCSNCIHKLIREWKQKCILCKMYMYGIVSLSGVPLRFDQ
jgi:hypothetical protein